MTVIDVITMIVESIIEEMHRGDSRPYPSDPLRRAALVCEEAGELIQAALDGTRDINQKAHTGGLTIQSRRKIYEEAKQTAAMAIRMMIHMSAEYDEEGYTT